MIDNRRNKDGKIGTTEKQKIAYNRQQETLAVFDRMNHEFIISIF